MVKPDSRAEVDHLPDECLSCGNKLQWSIRQGDRFKSSNSVECPHCKLVYHPVGGVRS